MKKTLFIFFFFFLIFTMEGFCIDKDTDLKLFKKIITDIPTDRYSGKEVIRERYVKIIFKHFFKQAETKDISSCKDFRTNFILNLFEDTSINVYTDKIISNSNGSITLISKLENYPAGSAILVVYGKIVTGSIYFDGRSFKISPATTDIHRITETDQSQFPNCSSPIPVFHDQITDNRIAKDTGSNIDVLVAYTSTARSGAGGTAAMENLINLAIAETNTGYGNSGVTQRVNLVHTVEVGYSEASFNWNTTLTRLQSKSDGYMDGIHTLRDTYGADLVVLIVNDTAYCGLAYLMSNVSPNFESSAFSLVSRNCATGYYSFAHEMGHNMGSQHDRNNAGSTPAYSYSYGYQSPTSAFRTIMAYNCPSGCVRVNYWSNPNNTYGGEAMGVNYLLPLAADNRRSLNNTLSTVRNFRQHIIPATITVTSPVSSSNWDIGSTHNVTWDKTGTMSSNVKINIFKDSISSLNFIEQLTGSNSGARSWTIGNSYTPGNYILRIKTDDNAVFDDSDLFTISSPGITPTITVTSPVSSSNWNVGSTHNVTWDKTGTMSSNVKINIFKDSISSLNFIEQLTGSNSGARSWTIGNSYTPGNYILRIKTDDNAVFDDSDLFTISESTATPIITINSPHLNETWYKNGEFMITWDKTGTMSSNIKVNIFKNSVSPSNFIEQLTGPNSGVRSWTIGNSYTPGNYILRIKTDDNAVFDDSGLFTIDNPPPGKSITITSPYSNDTWKKGSGYTIRWTKIGTMSSNVKINIFKNSVSPLNFVEQLTGSNTGSKNWTIPLSYTNGAYIIRIKTDDNAVFDDSGIFNITD